MKSKFTDMQLMKFADQESSKELSMDIIGVIVQDTPEAEDIRTRLEVFTTTRNLLIKLGEKNDKQGQQV
jgi:hypothetical protein